MYDLTDHSAMHKLMPPLLENVVMHRRFSEHREVFEAASPTRRAHRDAPPFFILHGQNDAVVPASQAHGFHTALRKAGPAPSRSREIPNAHHAFDTIATLRCQLAAEAVASFLASSTAGTPRRAPAGADWWRGPRAELNRLPPTLPPD